VASPLTIDRPSGPTAASTASSFVPAGKATTSVPACVPASTASLAEAAAVGVLLTSEGFALGAAIFFASVALATEVSTSGARARGTAMTTTYTEIKAAISPLPIGARDKATR
jgi:hypothetical protein